MAAGRRALRARAWSARARAAHSAAGASWGAVAAGARRQGRVAAVAAEAPLRRPVGAVELAVGLAARDGLHPELEAAVAPVGRVPDRVCVSGTCLVRHARAQQLSEPGAVAPAAERPWAQGQMTMVAAAQVPIQVRALGAVSALVPAAVPLRVLVMAPAAVEPRAAASRPCEQGRVALAASVAGPGGYSGCPWAPKGASGLAARAVRHGPADRLRGAQTGAEPRARRRDRTRVLPVSAAAVPRLQAPGRSEERPAAVLQAPELPHSGE